ncbi:MAG TPA: carbamate kinase [Mycobacteriales bacterium]|jgi:Carbamate kinase
MIVFTRTMAFGYRAKEAWTVRVVVALGGNALSPSRSTGSVEEMRSSLLETGEVLAGLVERGVSLVLTHGNGPQVGRILLQQEAAAPDVPPMPMDVCGAQSQGQIGYLLAQAVDNALGRRGLPQRVVTLVTQVVVDGRDPAFRRPTKPVGPYYDGDGAQRLAAVSGHVFREITPGRWRRVVASPRPLGFVENPVLRLVVEAGHVLVAAGGGGVPVVCDGGLYRGVEAVVDKDRTAAQLARIVEAEQLVILTEVPRVQTGFGTERARECARLTVGEARHLLVEGEFPEGSMGPKVEACCDFVEAGGERAVIAALRDAADAVFGTAGTSVVRD